MNQIIAKIQIIFMSRRHIELRNDNNLEILWFCSKKTLKFYIIAKGLFSELEKINLLKLVLIFPFENTHDYITNFLEIVVIYSTIGQLFSIWLMPMMMQHTFLPTLIRIILEIELFLCSKSEIWNLSEWDTRHTGSGLYDEE